MGSINKTKFLYPSLFLNGLSDEFAMILTIGIVSVAVVFALAFILNSVFLMRDYVEGLDHFDKQTYWSFIGGGWSFFIPELFYRLRRAISGVWRKLTEAISLDFGKSSMRIITISNDMCYFLAADFAQRLFSSYFLEGVF
jgi:hypothetical protein